MWTKYKLKLCLSYCTLGSILYIVIPRELFKKLNPPGPTESAPFGMKYICAEHRGFWQTMKLGTTELDDSFLNRLMTPSFDQVILST